MPQRYNAASEIVLPAPNNSVLNEKLNALGQLADLQVMLMGRPPGVIFMAGLELGIEATLADPDALRRVLTYIDSAKAEENSRDEALTNAEGRTEEVQELIGAANGVKLIAPPQPPGASDRLN